LIRTTTAELSGWNRYPRLSARVARPENFSALGLAPHERLLARGLGRSYGDAALTRDGLIVLTSRLNRFLDFDSRTGLLRAEAGATLAEVLETFVPRGWFPVVTPGTKFVTLGGCVAADVHGKNHHREGSFGSHVAGLELLLADGSKVPCSPEVNPELFRATVGGMGLTGLITEVAFRLKPIETPYMMVRQRPARDLAESLALYEDPALDDEYTVSWVDCAARGARLGRSVLVRGQHARPEELPQGRRAVRTFRTRPSIALPFDFPASALNRFTASLFNRVYYRRQARRRGPFFAGLNQFFYPLDSIGDWNRAYGRQGFLQYQCLLPREGAARGLRKIFGALAASRLPCTLGVLKRFGPAGAGLLSFPAEGYTLSLDFPLRRSELFALLEEFDEAVLEQGGRVYLAKDARLTPEVFRRMYPRHAEWGETKARFDPESRFRSELSRRLGLTPTGA
jgi:decaprenylphospho-beta-D-ribofuranose 2-oxidase